MDDQATEIRLGFTELATTRTDKINASGQKIIDAGNTARVIIIFLSLLTVVAAIITAILSASRISKNVVTITNRMKNIAQGDFSEPLLELQSKDELAQLTDATNSMVKKMNVMLKYSSDLK